MTYCQLTVVFHHEVIFTVGGTNSNVLVLRRVLDSSSSNEAVLVSTLSDVTANMLVVLH